MKKIIYIITISFLFNGCNVPEYKEGSGDEIPTSKLEALTNLADKEEKEEPKLLFTARGTEPGWLVEFYKTKLRLVVNYGQDSLNIESEFKNLDGPSGYTFKSNSITNNETVSIEIIIENKPCHDDATGELKSRSVSIKFKGKNYKGCGELVK